MPEEIHEAYVEIRLRETHEVVAVVEVLSPTNKRQHSDGHRIYTKSDNRVLLGVPHCQLTRHAWRRRMRAGSL